MELFFLTDEDLLLAASSTKASVTRSSNAVRKVRRRYRREGPSRVMIIGPNDGMHEYRNTNDTNLRMNQVLAWAKHRIDSLMILAERT